MAAWPVCGRSGKLCCQRQRAWEEFHAFAWKLIQLRQPVALSSLPYEEREDLLAEIIQDFQQDQFRLLRRYENRGRPFAVWFWLVIKRRALDRLRAMKVRRYEDIPEWVRDTTPSPDEEASSKAALEDVRYIIRELSPRCQLLLMASAEGYKPRDLLGLETLLYTDGKRLSDHLKNWGYPPIARTHSKRHNSLGGVLCRDESSLTS